MYINQLRIFSFFLIISVLFGIPKASVASIGECEIKNAYLELVGNYSALARHYETSPRIVEVAYELKESLLLAKTKVHEVIGHSFGDIAEIQLRTKSIRSIVSKLKRKSTNEELSPDLVKDGLGIRFITSGRTNTNQIVNELTRLIKSGEIEILEIENYHGVGVIPYLNQNQVNTLVQNQKRKSINPKVLKGEDLHKDSGYTTTQLNVRFRDGTLAELQIRGNRVQEISELEHIAYDVRKGKDLTNLEKIHKYKKYIREIKLLTNTQYDLYRTYLQEFYAYARKLEEGIPAVVPKLPLGISRLLALDELL